MRGGSNVLISPEEAARKLGVSRKTIYRRWQEWGWKGHTIGRMLRFREREVDSYIERITV